MVWSGNIEIAIEYSLKKKKGCDQGFKFPAQVLHLLSESFYVFTEGDPYLL